MNPTSKGLAVGFFFVFICGRILCLVTHMYLPPFVADETF